MGELLYKRCLRCNRKLRSTKAQQRGYGEYCWKEHLKECENKNSLFNITSMSKTERV